MLRIYLFLFFNFFYHHSIGQYNWKLNKDQDGIKVYSSELKGIKFKAVKVECTLAGNFEKLFSIIADVSHNSEWVYNSRTNMVLKKYSPLDFIYYTETHIPWPLSNRDAIIHMRIYTDSLPKYLTITGTGEPTFIPERPGKVRVPHYLAYWRVTMPTSKTIRIVYTVEVDPGGSVSSWISNMFVEKGPFETFKKLAEKLAK